MPRNGVSDSPRDSLNLFIDSLEQVINTITSQSIRKSGRLFAQLMVCLIAFFAVILHSSSRQISLYRKTEDVRITRRYQRHTLSTKPILIGTETIVTRDNRILTREKDYVINYNNGEILFLMPVDEPFDVTISYESIPFDLPLNFTNDIFKRGTESTETVESHEREQIPLIPEPQGKLDISGTKTFGVSMGTDRSLTPTQSLRVNISGTVGSDIDVTAVLTDQDLPIQPEGTSEEIQDLDQVLISITSPYFGATLGDYQAGFDGSEFVFLPKSLQGGKLTLTYGGSELTVLGAASRGKSGTITIRGIEGQNHYRITADGKYVVVVAGSETVWVNGERMKRGERNDYVIRDYGDPVIEFMPKRIISSTDIIRVDFEYVDEYSRYQQEVYGIGLKSKLPGGFVQANYALETDDSANALDPLSDEERALLVMDDRYTDDGLPITPPQRHAVWGISARASPVSSSDISVEFARSELDENTLSVLDRSSTGIAWRASASGSHERGIVKLMARRMESSFYPVGGTPWSRLKSSYSQEYQAESYDRSIIEGIWQPETAPTEGRYQLAISLMPLKSLSTETSLSRTSREYPHELDADSMSSSWSQSISFNDPKIAAVQMSRMFSSENRQGTTDYSITTDLLSVRRNSGFLTMDARWRRSRVTDENPDDGFDRNRRRTEANAGIGFSERSWISARTEFDFERIEGMSNGEWDVDSLSRTWSLIGGVRRDTADIRTTVSRREFTSSTTGDLTVNLADISFRIAPMNRQLTLDSRYKIDRSLTPKREEVFVKVPKGQGNYVKIDEYHYQEDYIDGEYIKMVRTVGDVPVASVDFSARLRFHPMEKFRWFSLELSSDVAEEQEDGDLGDLYALRNLRGENTMFGRSIQRIRIDLTGAKRSRLSLTLSRSNMLNRRTNDQSRRIDRHELRLSGMVSLAKRLSLSVEMEDEKSNEEISDATLYAADIRDEKFSGSLGLTYRLTGSGTVEWKLQHERNEAVDRMLAGSETLARMTSLFLNGNYALVGRGRFVLSYRLGIGKTSGEMPIATYSMYPGISHEVRASVDYRAHKVIDLLFRVNYRLLAVEGRKPEHRVEMEAIAEL